MTDNILDKITYHAVYDRTIMDALEHAVREGFAGVQAAVETPHLSFEAMTDVQCRQIAEFCSAASMVVTVHAPDNVARLLEPSEYLRDGVFRYFQALFAFAEKIGSKLTTIHVGSPAGYRTDCDPPRKLPPEDLPLYRRALEAGLCRLIDLAAGRLLLCIENVSTEPMFVDALQPHLDGGRLSLCWDLAKTHDVQGQRNRDLETYFWRNLGHVRQVHLHDIRQGHSHRVIGTGVVDFMHFLPRLAGADVRNYCIEVRPREKAAESLANLRRMLGAAGTAAKRAGNGF